MKTKNCDHFQTIGDALNQALIDAPVVSTKFSYGELVFEVEVGDTIEEVLARMPDPALRKQVQKSYEAAVADYENYCAMPSFMQDAWDEGSFAGGFM